MTGDLVNAVAASGYSMHDGAGWWMGGMAIWMVLFWVLVVAGIVWVVRLSATPRAADDALGVLDRRFAEGALSFDEYRERKATLKGERVEGTSHGAGASSHEGAV
jgi:putative membrane protein